MSSIGPSLPPHLTKRKRTPDEDEDDSNGEKHPRRESPQTKNADEIDLGDSDSDSDDMGPRMPGATTAALTKSLGGPDRNEPRPGPAPKPDAESDSESEDDDDFGPSLPSASAPAPRPVVGPTLPERTDQDDLTPKRDDWMLAPPPSSSTFSERDTTRIRARKFASKPSSSFASSTAAGAPSIWTETPEEKLRRLQNSILGRTGPSGAKPAEEEKKRIQEERNSSISAGIDAQRGKSLYEEHQKRRKDPESSSRSKRRGKEGEEEDDDPSKRAFDREKDMALGRKISASQRRELINKSADFGGKFFKGTFL